MNGLVVVDVDVSGINNIVTPLQIESGGLIHRHKEYTQFVILFTHPSRPCGAYKWRIVSLGCWLKRTLPRLERRPRWHINSVFRIP